VPTVSADIRIAAPSERVFDVLLDTASYAEWLTLHEGWPAGEPDITPGASFAQEVNVIGKTTRIRVDCRRGHGDVDPGVAGARSDAARAAVPVLAP
jgi:uncharacterized protein YndB with AHSA1/START domain